METFQHPLLPQPCHHSLLEGWLLQMRTHARSNFHWGLAKQLANLGVLRCQEQRVGGC